VGAGSGELIIEVESDLYDASDPGWMREVEVLSERLARDAPAVRQVAAPAPGAKGPGSELVLSIVGSGAGEVAAAAILAWVRGYGDRRVKIRRRGDDEGETLTVQDQGPDTAAVRDLGGQLELLAQPQDPSAG